MEPCNAVLQPPNLPHMVARMQLPDQRLFHSPGLPTAHLPTTPGQRRRQDVLLRQLWQCLPKLSVQVIDGAAPTPCAVLDRGRFEWLCRLIARHTLAAVTAEELAERCTADWQAVAKGRRFLPEAAVRAYLRQLAAGDAHDGAAEEAAGFLASLYQHIRAPAVAKREADALTASAPVAVAASELVGYHAGVQPPEVDERISGLQDTSEEAVTTLPAETMAEEAQSTSDEVTVSDLPLHLLAEQLLREEVCGPSGVEDLGLSARQPPSPPHPPIRTPGASRPATRTFSHLARCLAEAGRPAAGAGTPGRRPSGHCLDGAPLAANLPGVPPHWTAPAKRRSRPRSQRPAPADPPPPLAVAGLRLADHPGRPVASSRPASHASPRTTHPRRPSTLSSASKSGPEEHVGRPTPRAVNVPVKGRRPTPQRHSSRRRSSPPAPARLAVTGTPAKPGPQPGPLRPSPPRHRNGRRPKAAAVKQPRWSPSTAGQGTAFTPRSSLARTPLRPHGCATHRLHVAAGAGISVSGQGAEEPPLTVPAPRGRPKAQEPRYSALVERTLRLHELARRLATAPPELD